MSIVEHNRSRTALPKVSLDQLKVRLPILVLLYLVAVCLPIGFSLGSVNMNPVRLLLIVAIVPMAVNLLMGKYGRILPTDILFLLHFLWIAVALGVNNPNQAIQNAGSTGIEFIGSYLLGRAFIRNRVDFIALIRALAVVSMIFFPFALYETATDSSLILRIWSMVPGISSVRDLSLGDRMGLDRVQMIFVHPIHWGLYCALVLPLCFAGLKNIYSDTSRFAITAIVGISGLLALSSGALLAILMQIILFSWAWMFRHTDKRWIILISVITFFYVLIDLLSTRSPLMVFLHYATFSPHTAYWRTIIFDWGMVNVWANPVFGLGLNDWVRPFWMFSGSMDNFWLVMAVRYGIPGFAFIAIGYGLAMWKIARRQFDGDRTLWNLRRAWLFSFIGLTFTISTVHIWTTIYAFVFFMFGAGMWLLTAQPKDDTAADAVDEGQAQSDARQPPYARTQIKQTTQPQADAARSPYTRFPGGRS